MRGRERPVERVIRLWIARQERNRRARGATPARRR
jgi:hypothetical protein